MFRTQTANTQKHAETEVGIDDNDPPVEVFVTDTDGARPAESGQPTVNVSLYLPGEPGMPGTLAPNGSGYAVGLSYETVDGTATAGEDYTYISGRLTYQPGTTIENFTVPIIDDRIVEGPETFFIRFSDGEYVTVPAEFELYLMTINDNDTTSDRVDISAAPGEVAEADGPTAITVTAELNNGAFQTATDLTVQVVGGTATEVADFTAVADFTLTIPAGEVIGTAAFTLTPVEDGLVEDDLETITVTVSTTATGLTVAPSGGLTLQLRDSDARAVAIVPTDLTLDEGDNQTYTVALDSRPTGTVTVAPSLPAGAGISLVPSQLTFDANSWASSKLVTVTADQDADAANEQVTISHSVTGADYGSVDAPDVTVTVTDDDTPSTAIELRADVMSVTEDGGDQTIVITAEFDEAPPSGGDDGAG